MYCGFVLAVKTQCKNCILSDSVSMYSETVGVPACLLRPRSSSRKTKAVRFFFSFFFFFKLNIQPNSAIVPLVCQVSCCSASYSDVDLCQVPQQIAVVSELGVLFFLSFFPYYKGGKKHATSYISESVLSHCLAL